MLHALTVLGILTLAILAVWVHALLGAAVALSGASALLAVLFYEMGAGTAAVFELSVGAGLMAVLFIAAISLVKSAREERTARTGLFGRFITLLNFVLVGAIFFDAARLIIAHPPSRSGSSELATVGGLLWNARTLDVLGQGLILAAGILGIILLFRTEDRK